MKIRLPLFLALLAAAAASQAMAAPLPDYDVKKACGALPESGATYDRKTCTSDFEGAKAKAQAVWSTLPENVQEYCAKESASKVAWGGSYYALNNCIKRSTPPKE